MRLGSGTAAAVDRRGGCAAGWALQADRKFEENR